MTRLLCAMCLVLTACQTTKVPEPTPEHKPTDLEIMELIYEIEALEASKVYRLETDEEYEARQRRLK